MSNIPVDNGAGRRSFWTAGRWLTFLILSLFLWIGVYLYTHLEKVRTGYQLTRFTPAHIEQLNRILYNASIPVMPAPRIMDTVKDTSRAAVDSTGVDSANHIVVAKTPESYPALQICDDTCKINKALLYVRTEFDNKLQKDQEDVIKNYIRTYNGQEVAALLAQLKLKVNSFFWLSGPFMYLEMIFWVIFGVICSNLFALGNLGRTRGLSSFDAKDVPYQLTKFFYAPLLTIILIIAYNYLKHDAVANVYASEGMIVLSFIAGLFSGGMMSFLERLKDALLPEYTRQPVSAAPVAPAKAEPKQTVKVPPARETVVVKPKAVVLPMPQEPEAQKEEHVAVINDLYKEPEAEEPQEEEEFYKTSSSMAFTVEDESDHETEIESPAPVVSPEIIPQVVVILNLDLSGLYEEEKNEIIDIGFVNAVVTMHNVNGKEIITARKSDDKYTATFLAADVKPGIYIVRCTLTQKLSDDYIINLFGEKTVYITNENTVTELFIKKYEAID